jgi:hypothetical protein
MSKFFFNIPPYCTKKTKSTNVMLRFLFPLYLGSVRKLLYQPKIIETKQPRASVAQLGYSRLLF